MAPGSVGRPWLLLGASLDFAAGLAEALRQITRQAAGCTFRLPTATSSDWECAGASYTLSDNVQRPLERTTDSACTENPRVDVLPDGPLTDCSGSTVLTATVSGGQGPFTFQWTRDGIGMDATRSALSAC